MLEYNVKDVEIVNGGSGYVVNDALTIELDPTNAALKVTNASAIVPGDYYVNSATVVKGGYNHSVGQTLIIYGGTVNATANVTEVVNTAGYTLDTINLGPDATSGFEPGTMVAIVGVDEIGNGCVEPAELTPTSVEEGVVERFDIGEPGLFTVDIANSVTNLVVEVRGESGSINLEEVGLTTNSTTIEGIVNTVEITNGGSYVNDPTGNREIGSGIVLNVVGAANPSTGGEVLEVEITNEGASSTLVENPVNVAGGTGTGATVNVALEMPFEKVVVTDVPGTMPKPATEVEYMAYNVVSAELPINYNTTFSREYPVVEEESGEE